MANFNEVNPMGDPGDISGYDPLEGLEEPETPEVEDSEEEAPSEELVGEEEGEEVEEPTQPQPQPNDNVGWARARILERERDTLAARLNTLLSALQQPQQVTQEEPEEDLDAYTPEEQNLKLTKKLVKEVETIKQAEVKKQQAATITNVMNLADTQIAQFSSQNPIIYGAAVSHLAAIELDEFLDENPGLTPQEAEVTLMNKIAADKIKWLKAGKNPGAELYKRAIRRGFDPQSVVVPEEEEGDVQMPEIKPKKVQKAVPEQDSETQIKRGKQREQVSRSLSSVPGVAGKGALTAKQLAKMDESDSLNTIMELAKKNPGFSKTPSFRQLLAGKERVG